MQALLIRCLPVWMDGLIECKQTSVVLAIRGPILNISQINFCDGLELLFVFQPQNCAKTFCTIGACFVLSQKSYLIWQHCSSTTLPTANGGIFERDAYQRQEASTNLDAKLKVRQSSYGPLKCYGLYKPQVRAHIAVSRISCTVCGGGENV